MKCTPFSRHNKKTHCVTILNGGIFFMAKKGQKFNKYSLDFKLEIVKMYKEGKGSIRGLAKEYDIPAFTVKNWICNPERSLSYTQRGRPKDNLEVDYKSRYEILKKYQAFLKEQHEKK